MNADKSLERSTDISKRDPQTHLCWGRIRPERTDTSSDETPPFKQRNQKMYRNSDNNRRKHELAVRRYNENKRDRRTWPGESRQTIKQSVKDGVKLTRWTRIEGRYEFIGKRKVKHKAKVKKHSSFQIPTRKVQE